MKKWTPTLAALGTLLLTSLGAEDLTTNAKVCPPPQVGTWSAEQISAWCDEEFKRAQVDLKANRLNAANLSLLRILHFDPEHRGALNAVGFRHTPKDEIIPVPSKLLANGWNLNRENTWKPDPDFDHDNLKKISKKLRTEVRSISKRLGKKTKNDSLQQDIKSLQNYVQKVGPTALPELTRLYSKGQTNRERTFALATLAPLKPIHLAAELALRYPDQKDKAMAATQAAVLAKILPGGKIPDVMATRLERGSNHQAMRVAQLAAIMKQKNLRPRIQSRWRKMSSQVITMPGGARNVISVVEQRAYIRDLTAVVNVGIGLFDPDIGYIQAGSVLDVRVVKVEIFRTILEQLSGDGDPDISPDELNEINKEVFGRP